MSSTPDHEEHVSDGFTICTEKQIQAYQGLKRSINFLPREKEKTTTNDFWANGRTRGFPGLDPN